MSILTEKKDDVLYVDFNSPPVNVLNLEKLKEIIRLLEEEKDVKVIALKGSGKFFCAGLDVKDHLPENVAAMIPLFSELITNFFEFPGIVASVVQGGAFGGGCEIAFCSDLLISEKEAGFSQPEIKLGVFPPAACALYPVLFPSKVVNHIIYSGDKLTGEELERFGIVNKTFEKEELFEKAHIYLKKFTELSFQVIKYTKKATNVNLPLLKASLEKVNKIYLDELMQTEDAKEGLNAFLGKRPPVWKK